ncbi:MAG: ankyrin repeat domain-containing protein [Planctomycetota bacterium]
MNAHDAEIGAEASAGGWVADLRADRVDAVSAELDRKPRRLNAFLTEPRAHGREMWLPLHHAADAGALGCCGLLVDRGASPDCRTRFNTPWHARATPLHLACSAGHTPVVRRLVERGASVEVRDALGRSPLHQAACAGCAGSVDVLVNAGAMLDATDDAGRTALHLAIAGSSELDAGVAEASFDRGGADASSGDAEASSGGGGTSSRGASGGASGGGGSDAAYRVPTDASYAGCALRLIEAGADLDARCPKEPAGFTPLHRCVSAGPSMLAVAQTLLARGADPSLADPRDKRTARQLAEALGRAEYVQLLDT